MIFEHNKRMTILGINILIMIYKILKILILLSSHCSHHPHESCNADLCQKIFIELHIVLLEMVYFLVGPAILSVCMCPD